MIYFDNAATGGFKPRAVTDATESVLRFLSANPGRSGHRLAVAGAKIVSDCRETLAKTFYAQPDRVIFTKNCTEALNIAIFGILKKGDRVLTTIYEHNSVLRPLYHLKETGFIELDIVEPCDKKDFLLVLKECVKEDTKVIVTTAVSNVTGEELPIYEIAKFCKSNNLIYIVDGAQGGGHIPLKVDGTGISALALAGHKGLYGIMGSGALIIADGVEVLPHTFGGTGTESFNLKQPTTYPERLESGTLNLPAIASLNEGVRYASKNMLNFAEHIYFTTDRLINNLSAIRGVKCFSRPNRAGIVSFLMSNLPSAEACDVLGQEYDIAVRGGLHCAPLIHKHLNTLDCGLVRVSLAVQNSSREINYLLKAVAEISSL